MDDKLMIDWTQMPTYNTIMALLVGVSLVCTARLGKLLVTNKSVYAAGWALNFAVIGVILTLTGAHMTLTWPLAKYFPFDNILFGEPTLAIGVLDLALALLLWKKAALLQEATPNRLQLLARQLAPFSVLFWALGLMLIAIFFAGVQFQFFAAPKEEPISGLLADYPWVESWSLSLWFLGVGLCSILTGQFFRNAAEAPYQPSFLDKANYVFLLMTGWVMLVFGAMNYYTHIGLILHTMPGK